MNLYNHHSDIELIDLMKHDHQQALSALYFRYWDKLLVIAGNRLDNLAIAEECVQDVFCSLWKRRHELELHHSLATYLAVSVKYQVIKQMDKQYRQHEAKKTAYFTTEYAVPADEYVFAKEMTERIAGAIAQLPDKCSIVFKMSREQGMTNKQIAKELEIAEKTVEAHISKAIRVLRNDLATFSPLLFYFFIER